MSLELPPPLPSEAQTHYGDHTRQRLDQAAEGITQPASSNAPSYVNNLVRSSAAPNNAPVTLLEKKLKPHELKHVTDFIAGFLVREGSIRIVDVGSGGGMPKGKRPTRDYTPLSDKELALSKRHVMLCNQLSHRVQSGLHLIARMYVGQTRTTLSELGAFLARDEHKKAIEGALTDFFVNASYELERAERNNQRKLRNEK